MEQLKVTKEEQIVTSIPKEEWGVHKTHCCKEHGCKYGDKDCPVTLALINQKYQCEDCKDIILEEVGVWETKYKALLDSHSELLLGVSHINHLLTGKEDWIEVQELQKAINKAKNLITNENR